MKNRALIILGIGILIAGLYFFTRTANTEKVSDSMALPTAGVSQKSPVHVLPINHASLILEWDGKVIYADPTGGAKAYSGKPSPNIILITDIHADHLSLETIQAVIGDATLIVPQAVKDKLPQALATRAHVMANGGKTSEQEFNILAIPMYNLPESPTSAHTKGRGNGYVIERKGTRVYIAGDTAGTPEMRSLRNIDIAFVPMNLPFTMNVEDAADAVLAFTPKQVYPYHYREAKGFADINTFKKLVAKSDPTIDVVLLNWYPTP